VVEKQTDAARVEPIVMLRLEIVNLSDELLADFEAEAPILPQGVVWHEGMTVWANECRRANVNKIETDMRGNVFVYLQYSLNQSEIDEYECGLLAAVGWRSL
jgi:hypothetical protein